MRRSSILNLKNDSRMFVNYLPQNINPSSSQLSKKFLTIQSKFSILMMPGSPFIHAQLYERCYGKANFLWVALD